MIMLDGDRPHVVFSEVKRLDYFQFGAFGIDREVIDFRDIALL